MRVAICYNQLTENDVISYREVDTQLDAVREALINLGHDVFDVMCSLNLKLMADVLESIRPDCIFNLVDALYAHDQLLTLPVAVWDALRIPYTGASLECLMLSGNKVLAKQLMLDNNFPTPEWYEIGENIINFEDKNIWILKNTWDHGSRDLIDGDVLGGDLIDVALALQKRIANTGRKSFAEGYIDGREISVGIISSPTGIKVLPPTEVDYSRFPRGKPAILNYKSKWVQNSTEYHDTPIKAVPKDDPILEKVAVLTACVCELFKLDGWGRIDYRVDETGQLWILEINGNSCLSPDAGFQIELKLAGISFDMAISWILNHAMLKRGKNAKAG
jgi:D-alanine-D-alanine ligase